MNSNNKILENKIVTSLFSIIPLTYLIGSAVYELNFFFIITFFLYKIYEKKILVKKIINNKIFLLLIILWLYLIVNTFTGIAPLHSIQRNFLFIKFILLIFAIKFLIKERGNLNTIMICWTITLILVSIDVFYEFLIGKNILGFESPMLKERIVSFFKDELIVGSYLFGFSLPIIIYFINKKKIWLTILISIIFLLAIILSGERSMFLKVIVALVFFIIFIIKVNKLKIFIFFFFTAILILSLSVSKIQYRYIDTIKNSINFNSELTLEENILNTKYINQAIISYEIFKKNKLFGVGNKNYFLACQNKIEKYLKEKCYTHPHQLYYEFLSEHGIFGTIIIIYLLYKIIFKNYKIQNNKYFNIELFLKLYLIINMIPLIPTGSFFSSYLLSLFWINYSFIHIYKEKLNV
jgi:O-antigen ligase